MSEWFEWRDAPRAEFAVIGEPIAHSWSPRMMTAAFEALRLPYRYVAIRVPASEFSQALDHLAALGYWGLNVTLPLKGLAYEWAEHHDEFSERYSMANTLDMRTRSAANTDAPGFLETVVAAGIEAPSQVLVLGAGASGQSISMALADAGYQVRVWNRTSQNAVNLINRIGGNSTSCTEPDPQDCSLLVNATASSIKGEDLPVIWERASPGALAYDLAYSIYPTPFLRTAFQHGLQTIDGREMLAAQGARSLEWWLQIESPREVMRREVS